MTHFLYMDNITEGYVILFTGLAIVFSGLLFLTLFFKYALPVMLYIYKIISKGPDKKIKDISPKLNNEFTGEIAAAISIAVYKYLDDDQHDHDNTILTIKQARKMYSPWSSKIYGTYSNRL